MNVGRLAGGDGSPEKRGKGGVVGPDFAVGTFLPEAGQRREFPTLNHRKGEVPVGAVQPDDRDPGSRVPAEANQTAGIEGSQNLGADPPGPHLEALPLDAKSLQFLQKPPLHRVRQFFPKKLIGRGASGDSAQAFLDFLPDPGQRVCPRSFPVSPENQLFIELDLECERQPDVGPFLRNDLGFPLDADRRERINPRPLPEGNPEMCAR